MKMSRSLFFLGAIAALASTNILVRAESKPETPKQPVTNEYQGITVEPARTTGGSRLTSTSSGHGIGTALSERIKQLADIYAFLFAQLDMPAPAKK